MKKTFAALALAALAALPALTFGQTPLVNTSKMIADGIVTEPKLSVAVQAKLNAAYALIPTVQALGISTAALAQTIGAETAARIAADYAVGASTEALAVALLDEYNERVAADAAIGLSTSALDAAKVAKAGDSMSGSLSFTVPVTGINWQDGSVSTTGNTASTIPEDLEVSTLTVTDTFRIKASTPLSYLPEVDDILMVGHDHNGRPALWFYPPAEGDGGVLKLGMQMSGEGDPYDRDSSGIVIHNPTLNRTGRIKANEFSIRQGDNSGQKYVNLSESEFKLSTGPGASIVTAQILAATGKAGFGKAATDYAVDASSGIHATTGTFDGTVYASTFQAVGSAFLVGDSILNADGLALGAGSPIVLSGTTGDITATSFTGDGSGLTNLPSSGGANFAVVFDSSGVNLSSSLDCISNGASGIPGSTMTLTGVTAGSRIEVEVSGLFYDGGLLMPIEPVIVALLDGMLMSQLVDPTTINNNWNQWAMFKGKVAVYDALTSFHAYTISPAVGAGTHTVTLMFCEAGGGNFQINTEKTPFVVKATELK